MKWPLWYCLSPECRAKLLGLMPDGWTPPDEPKPFIDTKIESLSEIDKIMRKRPKPKKMYNL